MRTFNSRVPMECIEHQVHHSPHEEQDRTPRTDEAIEAFKVILQWLFNAKTKRGKEALNPRRVAARAYAMAYLVDAELIGGRSLTDIERETDGVLKAKLLSKLGKQFTLKIGYESSATKRRD